MVEAFAARSLYSCTSEKQLFFHSANESKPATQCEAPDLLQAWCSAHGVQHVEGAAAPLVFFKGFTRDFLAGNQGTSQEWIAAIAAAVDAVAFGKAFLIVGFPAVGSVVGVSNVEVAKASRAPVVVVGKSGVGGAIDAYTLNR